MDWEISFGAVLYGAENFWYSLAVLSQVQGITSVFSNFDALY